MKFTDIFIRRPVFATVVSLVILLVGARSAFNLPVRLFPKVAQTVINVTVSYNGASAKLMEGFVATPLENAVSSVEGVDYITSSSHNSFSTITVHFKLGYDIDSAFSDVSSKVASARYQLPQDIHDPIISKQDPSQQGTVYLTFLSPPNVTEEATNDYLKRVVQPQLQSLPGIGSANILGGSDYAMRIWLNPFSMAAHGVAANDVYNALLSNNIQGTTGRVKSALQQITLGAITDINTAKQFNDLVIKKSNGAVTHIKDVGLAQLGAQYSDFSVFSNGHKTIVIEIVPKSNANPLEVSKQVDKFLPTLRKNIPNGTVINKVWDSATFIQSSINEVAKTMLEATFFVVLIVFLFLGSLRILLIPSITIPLSLIGVCAIMLAMGYSFNTLTLMAMVLAIGMVVDDAIVVAENIHRHISKGKPPKEAALIGAREIFFAVISITLTLAAVYAPIGFLSGITGALFKEFAFTLASTVILSGFIALTLTPMMCSKIMTPNALAGKFAQKTHAFSDKVADFYSKVLLNVLNFKSWVVISIAIIFALCAFLLHFIPKDLAPKEDVGGILVILQGPPQANIDYTEKYSKYLLDIYKNIPETQDYLIVNGAQGPSSAFSFLKLKDWDKRDRGIDEIIGSMMPNLMQIPGVMAFAMNPSTLPGAGSFTPVSLALQTTGSYEDLYALLQKVKAKVRENPMLMNVDSDLKIDLPQVDLNIDRNKAGDLGISMQAISNTISMSLGEPTVGRFSMDGRSYDIIPQLMKQYRDDPNIVNNLQLRSASGLLVPMSNLVTLSRSIRPENLNHFQQMRSATLTASLVPGYSLGEALNYLQGVVKQLVPKNVHVQLDYSGESRQFVQEGNTLLYTLLFAIIFIFLILAAQFESFKSPFVVLFTVPLSTVGALIILLLIGATLNIYSEIGLITLVGLISKHGILMVEFANQLREQGKDVREAIVEAANIRLRPIIMTTSAMLLGALPLAMATGAGAVSRSQIGWVIIGGMSIGTLFTLFVIPTMYILVVGVRGEG